MEKLFLKTESKSLPIEQELIDKYHLTAGTISPFTRFHVVDEYGQEHKDTKNSEDPSRQEFKSRNSEPVFTTSESIDIKQGVDSAVEGNKGN